MKFIMINLAFMALGIFIFIIIFWRDIFVFKDIPQDKINKIINILNGGD